MLPRDRIALVLRQEAEAIAAVRVTDAHVRAVEILSSCAGKVVASGMGKAGHIARKFAATLSSTGTPAVFLHPGEAAHGDLGIIAHGDVLVAFSNSGKTEELLLLVPRARGVGVQSVVGFTGHPDAPLRDLADCIVDIGLHVEACPLGLTPTTSTAVMLAVSDAVALAVMESKGVTAEDFGVRHHGGYLGRRARGEGS